MRQKGLLTDLAVVCFISHPSSLIPSSSAGSITVNGVATACYRQRQSRQDVERPAHFGAIGV